MAELDNGIKSHLNGTVPIVNGHTSYAAKHKLADHFIGGNRLENAVAGPVKDFVANHDGHTVITNVGIGAAERERC
jgi:acetyl-CoA carboxylase / biotin carboxylase 1